MTRLKLADMVTFDYVVMSTALAIDLQDYARRETAEGVAATIAAVRRRGDDAIPAAALGAALRLSAAEMP